jgi:hypothetical protein
MPTIINVGSKATRPQTGTKQCRPRKKKSRQGTYETANRTDYVEHPYSARVASFKPKPRGLEASAPFVGSTQSQEDFVAHPGYHKRTAFKPVSKVHLQPETRDFNTDSRQAFKAHPYAKRNMIVPATQVHAGGLPFEGKSTSNGDFVVHSQHRPPKPFKPISKMHLQPETRDFRTASNNDFTEKPYAKRSMIVPARDPPIDGGKFYAETASSHDFPNYGPQRPRTSMRPPPDPSIGRVEDRDFQTASNADYRAKPYSKRPPMKPEYITFQQDAKFDARSNYSEGMTWHPYAKRKIMKPETKTHVGYDEDRTWSTEMRDGFKPQPYSREVATRVLDVYNKVPDDRDFQTVSKHVGETSHVYSKREPFTQTYKRYESQGPFKGQSVYRESYVPKPFDRSVSCKPAPDQHNLVPDTRDFQTASNADFVHYHREPCPAVGLKDTVMGASQPKINSFYKYTIPCWEPWMDSRPSTGGGRPATGSRPLTGNRPLTGSHKKTADDNGSRPRTGTLSPNALPAARGAPAVKAKAKAVVINAPRPSQPATGDKNRPSSAVARALKPSTKVGAIKVKRAPNTSRVSSRRRKANPGAGRRRKMTESSISFSLSTHQSRWH